MKQQIYPSIQQEAPPRGRQVCDEITDALFASEQAAREKMYHLEQQSALKLLAEKQQVLDDSYGLLQSTKFQELLTRIEDPGAKEQAKAALDSLINHRKEKALGLVRGDHESTLDHNYDLFQKDKESLERQHAAAQRGLDPTLPAVTSLQVSDFTVLKSIENFDAVNKPMEKPKNLAQAVLMQKDQLGDVEVSGNKFGVTLTIHAPTVFEDAKAEYPGGPMKRSYYVENGGSLTAECRTSPKTGKDYIMVQSITTGNANGMSKALIERLQDVASKMVDKDGKQGVDLYCVPDQGKNLNSVKALMLDHCNFRETSNDALAWGCKDKVEYDTARRRVMTEILDKGGSELSPIGHLVNKAGNVLSAYVYVSGEAKEDSRFDKALIAPKELVVVESSKEGKRLDILHQDNPVLGFELAKLTIPLRGLHNDRDREFIRASIAQGFDDPKIAVGPQTAKLSPTVEGALERAKTHGIPTAEPMKAPAESQSVRDYVLKSPPPLPILGMPAVSQKSTEQTSEEVKPKGRGRKAAAKEDKDNERGHE